MSAPKHPRKPRGFPEGELAFRSERGQAAAEHKRRSARPQKLVSEFSPETHRPTAACCAHAFTHISKIVRKRPSGGLAP